MNPRDIYILALDKWSPQTQIQQLGEECTELTLACFKWLRYWYRNKNTVPQNFIEEYADVEIMLEQMEVYASLVMNDVFREQVNKIKKEKLRRLQVMLNESKNGG